MNEFSIYLCVGAINFFVCVISMWLLSSIGIHYAVYTAVGYGLAICCSFFLNLKFTFKAGDITSKKFFKFVSINLCNLLLVEIIQIILIQKMQFREVIAIITGMTWYTLTGFFANKYLVYNTPSITHE